jgi:hypothetical protein
VCCPGAVRAATLNAGVGDDILIDSWTNYDISSSGKTDRQKLSALDAIIAEWGSSVDSIELTLIAERCLLSACSHTRPD